MGLSSGGRIEGGAVEIDPPAALTALDDGGIEVAELGVGVVEAGCHDGSDNRRNGGTAERRYPAAHHTTRR
jgi:hypothetical protein